MTQRIVTKNESTIVKRLRALVDKGKATHWLDAKRCAEIIGITRGRLTGMMNGYYSDEKVGPVLELVAIALESEATVSTQNNACSDLYALGVEKKVWQSVASCSRTLRVDRGVLTRILKADPTAFAQEEPTYLQQLLQKMRLALGPIPKTTGSTNDLIAGRTHVADQEINGLRFVLTAANFQPITVAFTERELEDTGQLIDELNRRLTLIAQSNDQGARREAFQLLGTKIDELFLNKRLIAKVLPIGALKKMEEDRKQLAKLRGE